MPTRIRTLGSALPAVVAGALLLLSSGDASAQRAPDRPSEPPQAPVDGGPRFFVGGGFWYAQPEGEFARYVDGGVGLDLNGSFSLDEAGIVSVRANLGFIQYGRETRQVCFSATVGCRILLDLTTSNDILVGGIGPELALPTRSVRPYLFGTAGFSYFSTRSSLEGTTDTREIAETENYGDGTLTWVGGGGMTIRLSRGRHPIDLDFGVEYHDNGRAEYLREGDIVDEPDGSITLHPTRSETDFTTFRVGVRVGIPRGGREADRPF